MRSNTAEKSFPPSLPLLHWSSPGRAWYHLRVKKRNHGLAKRRSAKAGLPPGTLVHIGRERQGTARVSVISYDEARYEEKEPAGAAACAGLGAVPAVTWISLEGIHEVDILEALGASFGLHPLVMEDILNTEQRPKVEDYAEYLYIVLKMLRFDGAAGEVRGEQISVVLGRNAVLSFQEGIEGDCFDSVRARIRGEKGRIRKAGPDFLAYSLIDAVVDNYFTVLEALGERIEDIEEELIADVTPATLRKIHRAKRDLIVLRKSVWPLREVISFLERGDSPLVHQGTRLYLRDVYDHTVQVIDTIETQRDMVSGMLDVYLSSVSNRLNAVMKVLTVIATIFMPLTFIVGIYGMNFRYMPELQWRYGYLYVWVIMISVGAAMFLYFKRRRWL